MTPHKLRVRIGNAEFVSIGREEIVKDQFDVFMGCLTTVSAWNPKGTVAAPVKPNGTKPAEGPPVNEEGDTREEPPSDSPPTELLRVFEHDGNGCVSLKALPQTDDKNADALLLLLYGFRELSKKDPVLGGDLLGAAKKSGLLIDRVDRPLDGCPGMFTKAGQRRGAKYGLTNPGAARAQRILSELFA